MVENIRDVVTVAGQHIGKLTDHFTTQNKHLESAANYFQASKENHRDIAEYYKQMIGPLDKLEADMTYVV